jgi:hypothetical protein
MSNYPLLNNTWIDSNGIKLPISNTTFACGILKNVSGGINGNKWYSLDISGNLLSNNNKIADISGNSLKFNVSGIYQITTSLKFTASTSITIGVKTLLFSYSTLPNSSGSDFSHINNWILGGIPFLDGSNNTIFNKNLFINGSVSGGSSDLTSVINSSNYGGNIGITSNLATAFPFFIMPNYATGSNLVDNINNINSIYYITEGTTLYFNIGYDSTTTTKIINATGNFTVKLLSTIGSVNTSYKFPLLNYNWTNSTFVYPIVNSYFVYGTLGKINNKITTTIGNGLDWDSLPVSSIDGTSIVTTDTTNQYNKTSINNLVTSIRFNNSTYYTYGLKFNVSGIYNITTALQFTGTNEGGTQQITGGVQTFAFSYSKDVNFSSTGADKLSSTNNNIAGPSNFGANICMLPNQTTSSNIPPFFILPNYMTSSIKSNVNSINAVYYIPAQTNIFFNIANTAQTNWLNATGNFTIELLNYLPVFVTNVDNLTVSPLQYINGYNYYTFVPTNTAGNGTAYISIPKNVEMNYLLVGGGGGGGGSYYDNNLGQVTIYCGGGGGGGQVLKSLISGSLFTLTVGGAGADGTANNSGTKGGDTTLTNILNSTNTNAIGGGGGFSYNTSEGGTGGGANGGKGNYLVSGNYSSPTNGGLGSSVTLSEISSTPYKVGGGGGGGGMDRQYNGGRGGTDNIGGNATSNPSGDMGGTGSGYGTGGGGAGITSGNTNRGGKGGPGFAVLYWKV